jgi:hypothetical protein
VSGMYLWNNIRVMLRNLHSAYVCGNVLTLDRAMCVEHAYLTKCLARCSCVALRGWL